jgi:Ca2+-binding RTX toxin-like protein
VWLPVAFLLGLLVGGASTQGTVDELRAKLSSARTAEADYVSTDDAQGASVLGGSGRDDLNGGSGSDYPHGGEGDDEIEASDGTEGNARPRAGTETTTPRR